MRHRLPLPVGVAPTPRARGVSKPLAACTEGGSLTPVTQVSEGEWLSWLVPAGALVIFGVRSGQLAIVVLGSVFSAGCGRTAVVVEVSSA